MFYLSLSDAVSSQMPHALLLAMVLKEGRTYSCPEAGWLL